MKPWRIDRILALAGLAALAFHAGAADDGIDAQEQAQRARIDQGRAAVEKRFNDEQAVCYRRFAVNDCLTEAKKKRRHELSAYRREENALNDARRTREGEKRKADIAARSSPDKQREAADRAARAQEAAQRRQERTDGRKKPPATPASHAGHSVHIRSQAQVDEAEEAYRKKLDEAASHRESRDRRLATRTKPPASALPPPR